MGGPNADRYSPEAGVIDIGYGERMTVECCLTCGAVVFNRDIHDDWHERTGTEPTIIGGPDHT